MVFRKYKPASQWGKDDTFIFKSILNARNARKMPMFRIPDAVEALGVKVHDATAKGFFASEHSISLQKEHERGLTNSYIKQHQLYNETPCRLFEGAEPMSDGMAQACVIAKAILREDLPDHVLAKGDVDVSEDQVRDAILHGERYDPTLEKLPRRFDPVIFWVSHPRVHGIPVLKRGKIILDNLFRHVILASVRNARLTATQIKLERGEPVSACLHSSPFFNECPLVIRSQPHLVMQSGKRTTPWASPSDVENLNGVSIPSISPLSPLIDLSSDHIYNRLPLPPRLSQNGEMHTIAWTREQDQKYPWTTEQNAANAIMHTFGAAIAEAHRRGRDMRDGPVMVRGVQLVQGKVDIIAVQLNTLDLSEECQKKNIVWVQKALPLYKAQPFYENVTDVEGLQMDTFKRLAAVLLA